MHKKNKNSHKIPYIGMYKYDPDMRDLVSCYFNALNQMKGCSYIGQYNDIDMYSNLSALEYRQSEINENRYE